MASSSKSRSSSNTSSNTSNTEEVLNVVNGDGDFNKNLTATGDNNNVSVQEIDNGAIDRAFDFGATALDAISASGNRANEISNVAIDAARGDAANSENLLKIIVGGAVIVTLGFLGLKVAK